MFLNDSLRTFAPPHTRTLEAFSPLLFLSWTVAVRQLNVSCALQTSPPQGRDIKTGCKISTAGGYTWQTMVTPSPTVSSFYASHFCLPLSPTVPWGGQIHAAPRGCWQAAVRHQLWRFPSQGRWESKLAFCSRLSHNYGGAPPNRNKSFHI